jgi:hypothetical protein
MIRCRITSPGNISCDRPGGNASASISWQTLELPTGLRVQRNTGNCQGPVWTVTLMQAVAPQSSLVLFNARAGGDFDDDNNVVARLTGPTTLQFEFGSDAGTASCFSNPYEWQVAELQGLTTSVGLEQLPFPVGETSFTRTALPATSQNTALLTQLRVPDMNNQVCNHMVRASMPTPTSIVASRGAGNDAGCSTEPVLQLSWQRLDFGARANVQQHVAAFAAGDNQNTLTISPVDVTRTLVFSSSQAAGGQSGGETNYGGTNNYFGEGAARFELLSSTTVRVTRGRSSYAGIITFYVVEIEP